MRPIREEVSMFQTTVTISKARNHNSSTPCVSRHLLLTNCSWLPPSKTKSIHVPLKIEAADQAPKALKVALKTLQAATTNEASQQMCRAFQSRSPIPTRALTSKTMSPTSMSDSLKKFCTSLRNSQRWAPSPSFKNIWIVASRIRARLKDYFQLNLQRMTMSLVNRQASLTIRRVRKITLKKWTTRMVNKSRVNWKMELTVARWINNKEAAILKKTNKLSTPIKSKTENTPKQQASISEHQNQGLLSMQLSDGLNINELE